MDLYFLDENENFVLSVLCFEMRMRISGFEMGTRIKIKEILATIFENAIFACFWTVTIVVDTISNQEICEKSISWSNNGADSRKA